MRASFGKNRRRQYGLYEIGINKLEAEEFSERVKLLQQQENAKEKAEDQTVKLPETDSNAETEEKTPKPSQSKLSLTTDTEPKDAGSSESTTTVTHATCSDSTIEAILTPTSSKPSDPNPADAALSEEDLRRTIEQIQENISKLRGMERLLEERADTQLQPSVE